MKEGWVKVHGITDQRKNAGGGVGGLLLCKAMGPFPPTFQKMCPEQESNLHDREVTRT